MKKFVAFLLAAVMLLCLFGCGKEEPLDEGTKKTFTVVVVYADKTEKTFTYETEAEFVGPVLEEAGLIKGNAGPYGMEITHVDGVQAIYAQDKAYWAVYEGEEYALQGIDTTPVVDGRTYKLVYEAA